jgi:predicted  nucleic acid-binding Zn-ribbon protein
VAVLSYLYRQQMEKRKKEEKEYQKLLMKQQQTEYELRKLRTHESEFQKLISEKEHFVQQQKASKEELDQLRKSEQALKEIISNKEEESVTLQAELAQYKQNERLTRQRTQTLKDRLYGLETYKTIRHKADNGKPLTSEDWTILIGLVDELTPEYSHFLTQKSHLLTERERQVCIMIRLYFSPKSMANVLETDKSIVTRMRAGLHQKLFDMPGTSRDLDQKLLEIL